MHKNWLKVSLFLLASTVAAFFACNKDTTSQTADDYLDQTLFSIQERGGMGKYGCYELIFPVTVNFPDSTTQEVNSYDELKDAIRNWFQANGGGTGTGGGNGHHHGNHHNQVDSLPHPTLAFPVSVLSPDGEIITVNNESELHDLKEACGGGTFGHHDHHGHGQHGLACFEIQFPITIQFPDSTTAIAADQAALHTLLHDWKHNNPGVSGHPEIVFPIQVVMKDDSTVVTVNSKQELHDLKKGCN